MKAKVAVDMATKMDTSIRTNLAYASAVGGMAKKRKRSAVVDSDSELELSSSPPNSDEDE